MFGIGNVIRGVWRPFTSDIKLPLVSWRPWARGDSGMSRPRADSATAAVARAARSKTFHCNAATQVTGGDGHTLVEFLMEDYIPAGASTPRRAGAAAPSDGPAPAASIAASTSETGILPGGAKGGTARSGGRTGACVSHTHVHSGSNGRARTDPPEVQLKKKNAFQRAKIAAEVRFVCSAPSCRRSGLTERAEIVVVTDSCARTAAGDGAHLSRRP
jgi:hypothetical protein